jgi:hypothetical protein
VLYKEPKIIPQFYILHLAHVSLQLPNTLPGLMMAIYFAQDLYTLVTKVHKKKILKIMELKLFRAPPY